MDKYCISMINLVMMLNDMYIQNNQDQNSKEKCLRYLKDDFKVYTKKKEKKKQTSQHPCKRKGM